MVNNDEGLKRIKEERGILQIILKRKPNRLRHNLGENDITTVVDGTAEVKTLE